jgi:transcription termination/antitermination protein NusG
MKSWYALHCRPNTERLVIDKLHASGVGGFYAHVMRRSLDGRRNIEEKFFPGYAFVHFDLVNRLIALSIPQVVAILGAGPRMEAIPDAEIEAVQQLVTAPQTIHPCPYVAAGDRVRVEAGPLRGLEGYVSYERGSARVVVSVTMLARSIAADVDRDSLQLIERAQPLGMVA